MGAEPLKAACKLAFAVAREGREVVPPIDAPAPMRSFLWVAQLPPRAISVAQRVINGDPEFRSRVAAVATEAEVGRAGYLWLVRPDGWEAEYSSLTGDVAMVEPLTPVAPAAAPISEPAQAPKVEPSPASSAGSGDDVDIDSELASLRSLVDRLADERVHVAAGAGQMEDEVVRSKTEASALVTQVESLQRDLLVARNEREAAELRFSNYEHERSLTRTSLLSAEKQLSTMRAETSAMAEERDVAVGERDAAVFERDAAVAEREVIQGELVALSDEIASLGDRLSLVEQERDRLQHELTQLNARWNTTQSELADITEQRLAMEAELDRLSEARVVSVQDNAVLFNRVGEQLARLEAERDLLVGQLEQATARLAGTRSAFDSAHRSVGEELASVEDAMMAAGVASDSISRSVSQLSESRKDMEAVLEDASKLSRLADTEEPISSFDRLAEPAMPEAPEPVAFEPEPVPVMPEAPEPVAFEPEPPPIPPLPDAPIVAPVLAAPVPEVAGVVVPPMPSPPDLPGPTDSAPTSAPPMPPPPDLGTQTGAEAIPPIPTPPAVAPEVLSGRNSRVQVVLSPEAASNPSLVADEVTNTLDIVLLVDGDAMAEKRWPTLGLRDRRSAAVASLEELAANSGAAIEVVFDGGVGAAEIPESSIVSSRSTAADVTVRVALAELASDYPAEWPVAVVTNDPQLTSEAVSRGATALSLEQLFGLFG